MRKVMALCILLLAGAVLLAAAPAAQADGITGNYNGQWKCTPPPSCEKQGGAMHGNIQQNGDKVSGQFTMENTVMGTMTGSLNGTISGNQLHGSISAQGHSITLNATVSGSNINGTFGGDFGNGNFNIHRQ